MTKKIVIIAGIVIAVILIWLAIQHFNNPKNVVVDNTTQSVNQKTEQVIVNDSTKGIKQDVLITYDQGVINRMSDSIGLLLADKAKLNKTILTLRYKETYHDTDGINDLADSLSNIIDSLMMDNSVVGIDSLQSFKSKFYATKIPFKINTEWKSEKGIIDQKGNISDYSLDIVSKPTIVFGEKTGFFKRPVYSVVVGNENKLITGDSLHTVYYSPKPKAQYSVGPVFLINNKGSYSGGVGATVRKGILSLTIGYQLINK